MSNALTNAMRPFFSESIRQRGEVYYARGAVSPERMDSTGIDATVTGQRDYSVSIDWSVRTVAVDCDCPYFEQTGPCKHVWAAAVAYDKSGQLPTRLAGKMLEGVFGLDDSYSDDYTDQDGAPGSAAGPPPQNPRRSSAYSRKSSSFPQWKRFFASVSQPDYASGHTPWRTTSDSWPEGSELIYSLDVASTLQGRGLVVQSCLRKRSRKTGQLGHPQPRTLDSDLVTLMPPGIDRQICAMLVGADARSPYGYYGYQQRSSNFALDPALAEVVLPLLCSTGHCVLKRQPDDDLDDLPPLQMDNGPPWEFQLSVLPDKKGKNYVLSGGLHRGQERQDLTSPVMLLASGWVFWQDSVARLDHRNAFSWIPHLRKQNEVRVPMDNGGELLEALLAAPALPAITLPSELAYEQVQSVPRPKLHVHRPKYQYGRGTLEAQLSFDYEGRTVQAGAPEAGIFIKESRRLILRDPGAEQAAMTRLASLGIRASSYSDQLEFPAKQLQRLVATLIGEDWNVEAEGALYRRAGSFDVSVSSGIDWFELHGKADFGGVSASLPQLLAALRKGEQVVKLDDGTVGVLPEEWLKKFDLIGQIGSAEGDHLKFRTSQAGFLDALLAAQPEVRFDAGFARVRDELSRFQRIESMDPPPEFVGHLRPYQREGLGWLHFLQRFGFGGCLADDMGLGKTVQVLAMLESRRQLRASSSGNGRPGPSLAVVPRSLIFNWQQEAARFTPQLRVLDHTGQTRAKGKTDHFDEYDLILTTYGTLRRDATHIKDVAFDYAIFDESQAIKNASTASAKAARLVHANHRLCLSGTPIENHLGELWSQFEVLNPGMLGTSKALSAGTGGNGQEAATRQLLSRALRPFILRRTKAQVATDLPEKTEQTMHCELEGPQRKLYNELRDHYRQSLLGRIEREGLKKSKIQVLEALLRLRQAAIHPGLIDKTRAAESSAKLEALLPRLREVIDEGHKTLVFSQFTTMLGIVRKRLDKEGVCYEYLDGKTHDRQARVERFQTDPACGLFLISLKAGGLGLNLTAAEYVFLLDPWWNPAVEAQAVDRAHRIGQTRQVFAYRLIARDTVEERIVELQQSKRSLADAIISEDNALIRDLSREDLELLLR